jgi:cobalt-zinc-cadmium efflux system membrane fusion protein
MNARIALPHLLVLATLAVALVGCSREPVAAHDDHAEAGPASHATSEETHRTIIPTDVSQAAGIETAPAGPGTITETITLYGAISADRTRVREVKARFPGVIRDVTRHVGDTVRVGDVLATVESNESLRNYTITAPIAGVLTQRHAEPGEQTETAALFEIADFSRVWAELKVFQRDRAQLRVGQKVRVVAEGSPATTGTIEYIAPTGLASAGATGPSSASATEHRSQSLTARVVLDNAKAHWTPGQFVEAHVAISEAAVPLAVPLSAVQTLDDESVVFIRDGEAYDARPITLGRRDSEHVEVLDGLSPGATLVVANSYLIKADIEKSSASHEH